MSANDRQVGGDHYKSTIQHWDWVWANNLDYFQGQITKYVARWKAKGGIDDLKKARHFLDKYIELEEAARMPKELVTDERTSWTGYTYEGGSFTWDMYKHNECKNTFKVSRGDKPVCPNCFQKVLPTT